MIWPYFTKESPCPACGHYDWSCRAGDTRFICMRVVSEHPFVGGGWYHNYGDKFVQPEKLYTPPAVPKINPNKIQGRLTKFSLDVALELGVSYQSLFDLSAAWSEFHGALAFPMRDGNNNIIGYRLRWMDGKKRAITGSQQGLFIPQIEPMKTCYLAEGPTDTAALLSIGLYAIGRPNNVGGAEHLKVALKRLQVRIIVIVADNDEEKADGRDPGLIGAKKMQQELRLPSVIWMPPNPFKDIRAYSIACKTAKTMIESDVNQKVWKV